MGIIRLTLITAATIWLAMMYFGRDEGLPDNRLGREARPEAPVERVEPATAPDPVSTPAPEVTAEPAPETAPPAPTPAPAPEVAVPAPEPTPQPEPPAPDDSLGAAVADAVEDALTVPDPVQQPAPQPEAEPAPEPVLYVTGTRVNVRSGPSTVYAVVTSLPRGAAVLDLGDAGEGWRMIRLPSGETAYMSGDFLSPNTP